MSSGQLRGRAAMAGAASSATGTLTAEHIELEADAVDGALCQSGYMLMADPAAGKCSSRVQP
jgi:hypothetical protein